VDGSWTHAPPRQKSSVHGSASSAHVAPSACGGPMTQPAASAPAAVGAHAALVHCPLGTQRLSTGTWAHPPALQTSSVPLKPSSQSSPRQVPPERGSVVVGTVGSVVVARSVSV